MAKKPRTTPKPATLVLTIEEHRNNIEKAYKEFKRLVMAVSVQGYETQIQKNDTIILVKVVGNPITNEGTK